MQSKYVELDRLYLADVEGKFTPVRILQRRTGGRFLVYSLSDGQSLEVAARQILQRWDRTALITGITGQDGYYLAKLLLEKGYAVHALVRAPSRVHVLADLPGVESITFHVGDLQDAQSIERAIFHAMPHEIYNLAAQSHVGLSFDVAEHTYEVTGLGAIRVFEAARAYARKARIYQASTSELFGNCGVSPQNESTPMHPASPYGCAKLLAHEAARVYREAYGMFIACGIAFNHESERRSTQFVTRKITHGLARIALGLDDKLELGDVSPRRDWGYAPEYVEAMWKMLQLPEPCDLVLATGEAHSVEEFLEVAAQEAGVPLSRVEVGCSAHLRARDVSELRGDASLAKQKIGWSPKVLFSELVRRLVRHDLAVLEAQLTRGRPRRGRGTRD